MAWSKTQNWISGWQTASNTTAPTATFTTVPASGSLVLAATWCDGVTATMTISDNFGDAGTWNLVVGPKADTISVQRVTLFWKIVGTPSGGLKTVTATPSVAATNKGVAIAEFSPGGGTVTVAGTPTSNAGNTTGTLSPGTITYSGSNGLSIGVISNNNADPTANATYTGTVITANGWFHDVEDKLNVTSGTIDPNWSTATTDFWSALGAVFDATSASGPALMGQACL